MLTCLSHRVPRKNNSPPTNWLPKQTFSVTSESSTWKPAQFIIQTEILRQTSKVSWKFCRVGVSHLNQDPYLSHIQQQTHGESPELLHLHHWRILQNKKDVVSNFLALIIVCIGFHLYIAFGDGTYIRLHEFVKHAVQAKVIKHSTVFIHGVWSHDSELCLTHPFLKIFYLQGSNSTTWIKHIKTG